MLYLVPTPIGNLSDMTFRAVEILKSVDYILAEDTRTTQILLRHYEIDARTISLHQHNEHKKLAAIIAHLKEGKNIAIVSDAGTPGISDPGFLLVRECVKEGLEISSLPGPSALITALVASGLPSDRFYFAGFLPHKKGRAKKWEEIAGHSETIILYESPYRIEKFLREAADFLGEDRHLCIARELTKIHEEYLRGTVSDLTALVGQREGLKGELVIIISGSEYRPNEEDRL